MFVIGGVKILGLGGGNFFVVRSGKVLVIYNEWSKMIRYLDAAFMTPDNNEIERAIRPFVIGRKKLALLKYTTRCKGQCCDV